MRGSGFLPPSLLPSSSLSRPLSPSGSHQIRIRKRLCTDGQPHLGNVWVLPQHGLWPWVALCTWPLASADSLTELRVPRQRALRARQGDRRAGRQSQQGRDSACHTVLHSHLLPVCPSLVLSPPPRAFPDLFLEFRASPLPASIICTSWSSTHHGVRGPNS